MQQGSEHRGIRYLYASDPGIIKQTNCFIAHLCHRYWTNNTLFVLSARSFLCPINHCYFSMKYWRNW